MGMNSFALPYVVRHPSKPVLVGGLDNEISAAAIPKPPEILKETKSQVKIADTYTGRLLKLLRKLRKDPYNTYRAILT
jgi:hypothetical protein